MTLPFLLLLVLIAAGLARRGWRRSAWGVSAAAALLGVAIGCGPAAGWLLAGLQTGYPGEADRRWGARTAIILLGGGDERVPESGVIETSPLAHGRLVKALELYVACHRQGGDCYILASGGDPRRDGRSEAEVFGARLTALGVAPGDIVLERRSLNTWQNAALSAPLLKQRPPVRVFLVTSALHLRRSLLYFGHAGVQASPVRADHVSAVMSPVPLSWNFLVADLALHEYAGILRYHLYQGMGWNLTAPGAGAL